VEDKKISFPKDDLPHSSIVEWWYFNGNLKTEDKKDVSFMSCLFKVDPKKVDLPFMEKINMDSLYFGHSLISDISHGTFKAHTQIYKDVKNESEKLQTLSLSAGDMEIREKDADTFSLRSLNIDLRFQSKKLPLLVGGGWVKLDSKDTYYYSRTNLYTEGTIIINGEAKKVSGKSWMDHQWSDQKHTDEDHWNWFSIQLENNTEIVCFKYGNKKEKFMASISYPDGSQISTEKVIFKTNDSLWTSPKTGAEYFLSWSIELPEFNMSFKTFPKQNDQEMIFLNINYWEGGIDVLAVIDGKEVKGQGFTEIVGIMAKKEVISVYMNEAKDEFSKLILKRP